MWAGFHTYLYGYLGVQQNIAARCRSHCLQWDVGVASSHDSNT